MDRRLQLPDPMKNLRSLLPLIALTFTSLSVAACTVESTKGGDPAPAPTTSSSSSSAAPGSSSSSSGTTAVDECVSIAGAWTVAGACGEDTCVITQEGCKTSFKCGLDGARGYTGTVKGTAVEYSGTTADGVPGTCTGTVGSNGNTYAGSCKAAGETCQLVATKK